MQAVHRGRMMSMKRITLELPDDLADDLSKAAVREASTEEAVAQDMLRRMVSLQRLEAIRRELRGSLRPEAPQSEDEIFEQIT